MTTSTDADRFFQTTSSLEQSDRKARKSTNTSGEPLKFPTKLLAITCDRDNDPDGNYICTGEAGGSITRVRLLSSEKSVLTSAAKAPVTCLTLAAWKDNTSNTVSKAVFAGCWDRSVWLCSIAEGVGTKSPTSFNAHNDFVKSLAVTVTSDKETILLSGGADGFLRFWSLSGQSLGMVNPQCRGIEYIIADPFASSNAPLIMFSTSQRDIFSFTLPESSKIGFNAIKPTPLPEAHATSVYKLHIDNEGDMWTASADKTCKRLVRDRGWTVDTTLQHPDFVRDVVTHDQYGLVLTACRDEEVRVWDKAGQLRHVFAGHYEEVTGLALVDDLLISISIDATLRRWSLKPQDLSKAIEVAKVSKNEEADVEPAPDLGLLTAEEEAELRALMEDEEAESLDRMADGEQ